MKSHWVDTAYGKNLDMLGGIFSLKRKIKEDDEKYRKRVKAAIDNFEGSGTIQAIKVQLMDYFGLKEHELEIFEYPEESQEFLWDQANEHPEQDIRSKSVRDELIEVIEIELGSGGQVVGVRGASLTNLDSGEAISFTGTLKPGQVLQITRNEFKINGMAIDKGQMELPSHPLTLPRRTARWLYSEATSPKLGFFSDKDRGRAVFGSREQNLENSRYYTRISPATIRLRWTANVAGKFVIVLTKTAVERLSPSWSLADILDYVNNIKAQGVLADIGVVEE